MNYERYEEARMKYGWYGGSTDGTVEVRMVRRKVWMVRRKYG